MDEDQDGEVSPFVIRATCKQIGLMDEVMAARLKKLDTEWVRDAVYYARDNPGGFTAEYFNLRRIIANMYQVAGAHDCPEHILDVLADPEGATDEQIEAMLPYHAQPGSDAALEAARYRFLRDHALMSYPSSEGSDQKDAYLVVTGYGWEDNPATVDEAVDAAMTAWQARMQDQQ